MTLPAATAAVLAWLAVALATWLNRAVVGWLPDDPPRPGRKQHRRPVPLAGITLAPLVVGWLLSAGEVWLALAATAAAAVGFLDDRGKEHGRDLDWRWKTLGLGLASGVAAGTVVDPIAAPYAFLVVAGFVFVLTNATNFLDNTDGVATTLAAVGLLALSGGSGPIGAAGWAALGFLPWNWPRSRVFLGDAGAYLLGIVLATAAARATRSDARALLAVAVPLVDFVQVVTARIVLAVPPWVGDRRHLTHVAQNLGVPRLAIAPLFGALAALTAIAAVA